MVPTLIIPDNPHISWATMVMAALLVIDVSAEIGEYFRALEASPYWSSDPNRLRQGRRAVTRASFQIITISFCALFGSVMVVVRATEGMDWRMTAVLEGVSRLEAAWLLSFASIKTPRLIGIYYSPSRKTHIQHVGGSLRALQFHVRYSILQYFVFVFCLLLPFCGRPTSTILGFSFGFNLSLLIYIARRMTGEVQARIALSMVILFAGSSAVLFSDGCHYIQTVWGLGWQDEWGLSILTFFAFASLMFVVHYRHWSMTEKMVARNSRFSTHDREERVAISLIFSRALGSRGTTRSPTVSEKIQEEADEDDESPKGEDEPPIWSLIKMRWSAPSDLVFLTKADIKIMYLICALSLFVVIVNVGATAQMRVVRQNFHDVHNTLYGKMDEGPVCAFKKVNGTIREFPSMTAAHRAGYKIAHCGACGACSDWHNLRLQYTTRTYLAKASARCGRKSLIGGRDAVLECLHDDPIGFKDECAECWAWDIFCARRHCAFIFLQSNLINTMANFEVGEDTITSATCEEAMCELEFVPCSGANRRRMNIASTIKRPGRQLCQIIDVDWAEVFAEDDPSSDASSKEEL